MAENPGYPTGTVCDTIHRLLARDYSLFEFAQLVRTEIGLVAPLKRVILIIAAVLTVGLSHQTLIHPSMASDSLPKAADMLPAETQAFLWLPSSSAFLDNWAETELGKLAADERLKDFWTSQQESIRNRLSESGWQLNVKFDDLPNICTGQAAMGWITRESVTEKPFSLGVIIDVQGREEQVDELMQRIEKEMTSLGASRQNVSVGDLSVKHYRLPKVATDTRSRESYYVVSAGQLLAADDLITVEELIKAQQKLPERSLARSPIYEKVRSRIHRDDHAAELEYFVQPIGFGRLLRAVSGKTARGQVDMLKLLEGQGFGSLLCAAGSIQFNKDDLDMHHQGFILREEEIPESVQILDFPNNSALVPPPWIDANSASVLGFSWNFSEAFPKFKGLVDAYIGEEQFDEILEGIKLDPNGPQIDIESEILPYVGTEFYAITEIEPPITPESKRSLICIKLKDPQNKLTSVLNRYSKTEPGSSTEDIGDYRVWKFSNEEVQEETLDFDAGPNADKGNQQNQQNQPLLKQWAVTLIDGWFVFASNPEILAKVIERASDPSNQGAFEGLPDVQVSREMQEKLLGGTEMSFSEIDLSERSFEMQYELFRQNILPESRSLLALIAERLLKTEKPQPQQLQGGKLPPYDQVKKFFTPAGMVVRTEKDGWGIDGFILGRKLLKKTMDVAP